MGKSIPKSIPRYCTECRREVKPKFLIYKVVHSVAKVFCSERCWKLFKSREFEK